VTTYDWPTIRADAIARFGGDAPRAELEQQIIDTFEQHPQLVVLAIDKIADGYQTGRIRSPWAVLKTHIERAAQPGADIQAEDTTQKQKRIQRAEAWIKAAGIHFDRQTEILLELFSGSGLLASYAHIDLVPTECEHLPADSCDDCPTCDTTASTGAKWKLSEPTGDHALVDRITHLWNDARPTGIALEQDAEERAAKWRREQTIREEALAQAHAELQAEIGQREHALIGAPDRDPDDDLPL
jgi:hypothetical protein